MQNNDIDSREFQECIDWNEEIQNNENQGKTQFLLNHSETIISNVSTNDIDSAELQECIDPKKVPN
jgi:hypothetical protein